MSVRWRRRGHAATALLSLALWLMLATAEVYPAFHAWLHGGSIPDNDNCAVVALAHGKVETITTDAPLVVAVTTFEIVPLAEVPFFRPPGWFLPDGRGPPNSFMVS